MKDETNNIDPQKWGWRTWLIIDIAVGLMIVVLINLFS